MAYKTFDFTVADHVAQIVFNRPDKANAMILPFWQEMADVFAEIEDRPEIRAVVISATGRHFTGGLDLSAFANIAGDMLQGDRGRVGEQMRRAVARISTSSVIAVSSMASRQAPSSDSALAPISAMLVMSSHRIVVGGVLCRNRWRAWVLMPIPKPLRRGASLCCLRSQGWSAGGSIASAKRRGAAKRTGQFGLEAA